MCVMCLVINHLPNNTHCFSSGIHSMLFTCRWCMTGSSVKRSSRHALSTRMVSRVLQTRATTSSGTTVSVSGTCAHTRKERVNENKRISSCCALECASACARGMRAQACMQPLQTECAFWLCGRVIWQHSTCVCAILLQYQKCALGTNACAGVRACI